MTYSEFIESYCKKFNLVLDKEDGSTNKLSGDKLLKIRILAYLLRMHYSLSYNKVSKLIMISRQMAMYHYYEVLRSELYRKIADDRYKEMEGARNIQANG